MRVAHVITRMIVGGAQENTLFTCEDLLDLHGDEVLLITGPSKGPEGSLLEKWGTLRVPVDVAPSLRRAIHPWYDSSAYVQVKRRMRRFRPDVVHTHSAKAGILGRAAAWSLGVPAVVHTIHGSPVHTGQGRAASLAIWACERWAARRCHAMIGVADAMTQQFVAAGVARPEKFTTIYSGMAVEPFLQSAPHRQAVRQKFGFTPEDVVVGKIARLFHHKGHEDVIRAAGQIVAQCPQTRFLFVGGGLLMDRLQSMIDRAGLTEHFRFTGLVPPEKIPELISAMDVVVHASYREGLARALPQALLAGKPVVSYDVDGAREVAIPGETGFLVPPGDIAGLSTALLRLIEDAPLREQFGRQGRNRLAGVFRHQAATARIRKLYEQLVSASSAGRKP